MGDILDLKDCTKAQLIAMLEEANDIIDSVADFLGTTVVHEIYVNYKKGDEEE
tara:strand:+ start:93 stop:251 length:159 start_codon:yes stop_codon:yes gene_type:complete